MKKDIFIVEQGSLIKAENNNLIIKKSGRKLVKKPLINIKRLYIKGHSFISTHLLTKLINNEIDIIFMDINGNFQEKIPTRPGKNINIRIDQYNRFNDKEFVNRLATSYIKGKVWNMYIIAKRYLKKHLRKDVLNFLMNKYYELSYNNYDSEKLLGIEGVSSKKYFSTFDAILKDSNFAFKERTRRPPQNEVNAMLSLGYTFLLNEVLLAVENSGIDSYLGFLHKPEYSRPSFALDIMEEFRPVIVDSLVLSLINKRIVKKEDFKEVEVNGKKGVYFDGKKISKFIFHFNYRMETKVFNEKEGKEMKYRDIVRGQVYKVIKTIKNGGEYKPYKLRK